MQRRKNSTDWDQMLLETGMDQWDVRDRREMQANLLWVSEHRKTVGSTRRFATLAIGIAVPLLAAFGSWIGNQATRETACPSGYVCTVTAVPTPTP